jgi:hypothetical protein
MRVHKFLPLVATSVMLGLWCKEAHATEVTVVSSRGSVSVTQDDHLVPVSASAHLTLPAQIRTGSDGVIDLKDNGSLVHIGPNSTVAIPDSGPSGGLVDRYLQSAGSALYNIQGRHGRPMSVETPYLVSVVKGTVFTVSVEEGATSVTLMEGSLDVAAPDVSQHLLLKPNQSIRHSPGEPSLMVSPARAESEIIKNGRADDGAPLADEANSSQVAFVTRDLAEVGATVSAQHALSTSALPAGSATAPVANNAGSPAGSSGGGSQPSSGTTGSASSTSTGTTSGTSTSTSGSTGSSSASSSPSGSGSTSTGATSGTSTSTTSGSTSTAGSTSGSGSSNTAGSPGNQTSGSSTAPVVGCNGKTNGTGLGKCLGHGKN